MQSVFVDTGAWIGILKSDDRRHRSSLDHYRELRARRGPLITSDYIVDEAVTRLRYDVGLNAALELRNALQSAQNSHVLRLVWVTPRHYREAWKVLERFADVKLSFTDATSILLAREWGSEVFSFDSGFAAAGLTLQPGL